MFKKLPNKRDSYVPRLIEPIYRWVTRGSKDKSLFPSHRLVMMTCCVICYGPYCTRFMMSQRRWSRLPRVPSWCNLKMVIFPSSSGNCTIVDPINELPQQMFFNFSREQSLRHQNVRYKYKFAFGLNSRRNILSCIFPQTVDFKVKKTFIYKKLGNWTTEKELRV